MAVFRNERLQLQIALETQGGRKVAASGEPCAKDAHSSQRAFCHNHAAEECDWF